MYVNCEGSGLSDSQEPLLLTDGISTEISCTGPNIYARQSCEARFLVLGPTTLVCLCANLSELSPIVYDKYQYFTSWLIFVCRQNDDGQGMPQTSIIMGNLIL